MNNGYIEIYCPDNPRANEKTGFVYLHVLQAERKLGRYLNKNECVHHLDGDKTNNDLSNLVIFRTGSDHSRFHKLKNPHIYTFEDGTSISYGEKSKKKSYSINKNDAVKDEYKYWNSQTEFNRIMNTITTDDLIYSLLRLTFGEVAKSLGISDKYLVKILKKLGIPYNSLYYRNKAKQYNIKYYTNNIMNDDKKNTIYGEDFRNKISKTSKDRIKEHGGLKLKYEDVLIIKSSNKRQVELAKEFNVSRATISRIKNGIIWK